MSEMEQQNLKGTSVDNSSYVSLSALQIRLNTTHLIDEIEMFLSGERIAAEQDSNGYINYKTVQLGKKICNNEGKQMILYLVQSVVNPHTVQGNIDKKELYSLICSLKLDLAYELTKNWRDWEIEKKYRRHIVRTIEKLAFMFLTRPVDNKERDSYSSTIRTVESNTLESKNRGILQSFRH